MTIIGLIVCLLSLFTGAFAGLNCEQENFFGITTYYECPRPDDPSAIFCCENGQCCSYGFDEEDIKKIQEKETKSERKKRENFPIEFNRVLEAGLPNFINGFPTKDDYDKYNSYPHDRYEHGYDSFDYTEYSYEGSPSILPEIIGGLIAIVLVIIVVCVVCCCCCPFCLLYKRRQRGIVHNPPPNTGNVPVYYQSPQNQPQVVVQQQPYVPVQSTSPYPMQQYPAQGYTQAAPAQGYPQASPAPYPVAQPPYPAGDKPPPYDKQMAFNPNY